MSSEFMSLLPLFLILGVAYFLVLRPQSIKMREHQKVLAALRRGDKIITGGGIIGVITKIGPEDEIQVEIAENVKVRVQRTTIAGLLTKTEAVPSDGASSDKKD